MDVGEAEAAFRERLSRRPALTVGALLGAMVDFYREARFDTVPLAEDGDGLLLEWGTFDWGQGRHFEFGLTRQFVLPGEDEPFHLSMTMRFEPTAALSALGRLGRFCLSLEDLGEFEDFMRSSPPYLALMSSEPGALDIHFGQV